MGVLRDGATSGIRGVIGFFIGAASYIVGLWLMIYVIGVILGQPASILIKPIIALFILGTIETICYHIR